MHTIGSIWINPSRSDLKINFTYYIIIQNSITYRALNVSCHVQAYDVDNALWVALKFIEHRNAIIRQYTLKTSKYTPINKFLSFPVLNCFGGSFGKL